MQTSEQLAQIAYDAYGATTDHKNYQGLPMPKWEELPEKIRGAWIAAVERVKHAVLHPPAPKFREVKPGDTFTDADLVYSAMSRCPCGAGLAYPKGVSHRHYWDCADILTGRAIPSGQSGSKQHTDRLPFAFYEVKSENQPSAEGATTRPR